MRIFSSVSLTLLAAAVSCMVHDEIRETGFKGSSAVIICPYTAGYEGYLKYFCRGTYKDCKTLIKTNGKDEWTYEGRFSLHDDTEKRKIVVTITDLRMEDAGFYGCGIMKIGQDPFTLVYLSVVQAPKPPPTTQSTTSATTVSTHKTPEQIVYIGAGLAALLLLFAVFLFVLIKQVKQRKAAIHQPDTAPPNWNQHLHHNPHTENVAKYSPVKTSCSANQRTPSIQNTPTANRRSQPDPSSAVYSNISAPPHDSLSYATVNFTNQPDDLNYSSVIFVRESDSNTSHAKMSPVDTARSSLPLYSTVNPTNISQSEEDTNTVIYANMKKAK